MAKFTKTGCHYGRNAEQDPYLHGADPRRGQGAGRISGRQPQRGDELEKRVAAFVPKIYYQIAEFYHVSPQYLRGKTDEKQDHATAHGVTDEDIKFALFGSGPVTDAQYEEVKQFVRFIKERDAHGATD